MCLSPDQMNVVVLDEIREVCRAAQFFISGGMSLYASREHRRTTEWVLEGRKKLAEEILAKIGE